MRVSGRTPPPVTLKISESVPVPALAVMVWAPVVALLGIVITLLNVPVVPVDVLPLVGVMFALSNLRVNGIVAGKPVPVTVIEAPAVPDIADKVIVAPPVTVNVAVRVTVPAVTVIVWAPDVAVVGIVIVLKKSPLVRVLVSPVGVSVVVSNWNTRLVLTGKLEPETVTVVPPGPDDGDRGSSVGVAGAATVRLAFAMIADSPPAVRVVVTYT